jgi:phage terminase large subunit-like protein
MDCWCGIDLSSIQDFSAVTLVFKKDDLYYFKHRFYIPSETIIQRYKNNENINILDWINRGIVTAIDGPVIDYCIIFEDIKKDMGLYRLKMISFDRWGSRELINLLEDEFPSLVTVPFQQNLAHLSQPTKNYEKLLLEKRIIEKNPCMKWMLTNTLVKADSNDNYRPLKDYRSSTSRIDGVISSILALDCCLEATKNGNPLSFEDLMALI